jgi:hypothetical protein
MKMFKLKFCIIFILFSCASVLTLTLEESWKNDVEEFGDLIEKLSNVFEKGRKKRNKNVRKMKVFML